MVSCIMLCSLDGFWIAALCSIGNNASLGFLNWILLPAMRRDMNTDFPELFNAKFNTWSFNRIQRVNKFENIQRFQSFTLRLNSGVDQNRSFELNTKSNQMWVYSVLHFIFLFIWRRLFHFPATKESKVIVQKFIIEFLLNLDFMSHINLKKH